ncbi:PhzF family phenazine biosynthesis protein [Aidingimonas halophila]|uniref:Phenazine biosynthesis protein PhzF family n=1 Tax=Aidingimonas halophila TaxID=574349 RepID=A0A1H3A436_9GAMM|nr:PhzF family phenazine biosynthesis protein [Aidingimonas halophila]GHC21472.1 oxidoreductase [Aidingimonas halophila]SDX23978.1 phenazine biosynthesis protein PhzF family [Aidingimonas halophila]
MANSTLYRFAAFSDSADGGNPAGIWLGEELPSEPEMQAIAAEVGYSETAFITPTTGKIKTVRYFSPEAEVPFCGHATIASGVVLGRLEGAGSYVFATVAGDVTVVVENDGTRWIASLTSVDTKQQAATGALLSAALDALGWSKDDLDQSIPPICAYGGAWHLVLVVKKRERLANLSYNFEQLKALMLEHDLTTLELIWKESEDVFHSRNPFPVGGVVEDPATGAAAAAFGGYLRDSHLMSPPLSIRIHQGDDMGRPSLLSVSIPESGGVTVSGTAVEID